MLAFAPTLAPVIPPSSAFLPRTLHPLSHPTARRLRRCSAARRRLHPLHFAQPLGAPRASSSAPPPLVLSEHNVQLALDEARESLGSIFGNSKENRDIGITGEVELASIDGPVVVLRLKGRFWHKRSDVLSRVTAYLTARIPEICDTEIEDVRQLDDSEEETTRLPLD